MSLFRLAATWGVTLFLASVAAAAPRLSALTKTYAEQNHLPVRVIKNDLGTRVIEREFVPVLPTTHQSFLEHFQSARGAVIWRVGGDAVHIHIGVRPDHEISYGKRTQAPTPFGGRYLTLALDQGEVASWERLIDTYTPAGHALYRGVGAGVVNFYNAMTKLGNPTYGGCMWWVVHAELAPGLNLATAMGVRRAKGPEILAPRLVHAGNERVGPIGVAVNTIEQFNQMTDEQLMGPEPAGGAAEQVKE
jgi:hypothetical protein